MLWVELNYAGVWGNRLGFGQRPALLLVDFAKAYTDTNSPLYATGVPPAVQETEGLLSFARESNIPVFHTTIKYYAKDFADGGIWLKKSPVMEVMRDGSPYGEFCDPVKPRAGEVVIVKQYASSFFGTSLASTLHAQNIDTIVLAGCSTSGCIRATAVDGVQHGFRVIVVRECVGDRHIDPHEANLFDINAKYGDVVSKEEAIKAFASLGDRNDS